MKLIDTLNKTQQEMRWTNHPRIFLEVAIVQLCQQVQQTASKRRQMYQADYKKCNSWNKNLDKLKTNGSAVVQAEQEAADTKTSTNSRSGFQIQLED